jgi:preprotein translocase subunit YajC
MPSVIPGSKMLITPAYAQGAGGSSDVMGTLVPILLMFVIFYYLLFRPQQQRMKQHRAMIEAVKRNDTVVMSSGIIGKVTKTMENGEIEVEIAQNTRVRVIKSMLADVRTKAEPAKDNA